MSLEEVDLGLWWDPQEYYLSLSCQGMFEPYLKSFYIRSTDPTQIKILKVSARPLIPANLLEYQPG